MPTLTLVAFKRSITTGCVLDVTDHRHPALVGRRAVVKVDTTGFYLEFSQGHPKRADCPEGSFLSWPRASGLAVAEDGSITVTSPG